MGDTSETAIAGLSKALQEKARNELGEKAEWRDRDIQALRDIIKSDLSKLLNITLFILSARNKNCLSFLRTCFLFIQLP